MTYFTRPSSSALPGGKDGETEVIYGQERPWLIENIAVARCLNPKTAERIAELLRKHGR
jgi:hypothetical protein